ncbi:MAG: tRNA lysidine(34) synthetase TilS [Synechococcaceae cyanobacterium]|nr:tRNA lysidine(34) synthetase TilS [Synechococcaceae cyanobacterium]
MPTLPPWSPDHLRLHRHLLRRPELLPAGAPLLLAVSGGQDSMALTGLLCDLRRLHGWRLLLWHGDHGWRAGSAREAEALAGWAAAQALPLHLDRARDPDGPGAAREGAEDEATARTWRYACLSRLARQEGCGHVVTGHTASDRAETVLLNLARGCHRRGLASMRASRRLESGDGPALQLVRPLLPFSREDTARICRERNLPVWPDPSNDDPRFSRNRLRQQLLPVLERLHPGASRRIAAQAGRLADELAHEEELLNLALAGLTPAAGDCSSAQGQPATLDRHQLAGLASASQGRLLSHWIREHSGIAPAATVMGALVERIRRGAPAGQQDLQRRWQLTWDASTLKLLPPDDRHG